MYREEKKKMGLIAEEINDGMEAVKIGSYKYKSN